MQWCFYIARKQEDIAFILLAINCNVIYLPFTGERIAIQGLPTDTFTQGAGGQGNAYHNLYNDVC